MGNSASSSTVEQNEAASAEAMTVFEALDVDANEGVSLTDWNRAFASLDTAGDGVIRRKDWFTKLGTTLMYDAVNKQFAWRITKAEWNTAFDALEPRDGKVSVEQWLGRRKVRLGFFPLKFGIHSWGVGVTDDFYEVASLHRDSTEMAAVGPRGIIALGDFAQEEGGRERWLLAMQEAVKEGRRHERSWLEEEGEPRSRPQDIADRFENAGWTAKTDEHIETWIKQWVAKNPRYRAMDPLGRECNEQTFAVAFISFLIGGEYKKITDGTKGRAVVYGGLALLAGVGVAAAVGAINKNAARKRQDSNAMEGSQSERATETRPRSETEDNAAASTRSSTKSEDSMKELAAALTRSRARSEGAIKEDEAKRVEARSNGYPDASRQEKDAERELRELYAELERLRREAAAKDGAPSSAAQEGRVDAA